MPQTPLIKRKRIGDEASARVFRPFKSPLRTEQNNTDARVGPCQAECYVEPLSRQTKSGSQEDNELDTCLVNCPSSTPGVLSKCPSKNALSRNDTQAQELRLLESQISNLRSENDILAQALKLLLSSKGIELEQLRLRWRDVSRAVAEELFAQMKDKVNQMGGVDAWKKCEQDLERRRNDFFQQDPSATDYTENENEKEEKSSNTPEERRRVRREREEELAETPSIYDLEGQEPRRTNALEDCRDDDTFTMSMMLTLLNVDRDLIGYDKEAQQWFEC